MRTCWIPRGTRLYDRGVRRVEPYLMATKRVVSEAVQAVNGGVGDASSKIPLVSSVVSRGSVF